MPIFFRTFLKLVSMVLMVLLALSQIHYVVSLYQVELLTAGVKLLLRQWLTSKLINMRFKMLTLMVSLSLCLINRIVLPTLTIYAKLLMLIFTNSMVKD
jgi:hypothetical protein